MSTSVFCLRRNGQNQTPGTLITLRVSQLPFHTGLFPRVAVASKSIETLFTRYTDCNTVVRRLWLCSPCEPCPLVALQLRQTNFVEQSTLPTTALWPFVSGQNWGQQVDEFDCRHIFKRCFGIVQPFKSDAGRGGPLVPPSGPTFGSLGVTTPPGE